MSKTHKIGVLDCNKVSSNNWKVLLRFIGEAPVLYNEENWREELATEQEVGIYALIFGGLDDMSFTPEKAMALLDEVLAACPNLPVLYFAEAIDVTRLQHNNNLILISGSAIQYQNLAKALSQVRAGLGLGQPELKSKLFSPSGTAMFRSMVGTSEPMQRTREQMQQVADKNVNVLIYGQSGTGKEILARNIHYHSGRSEQPFIVVSCATLNDHQNLLELVGEESTREDIPARTGLFEKAAEGTIFLDEIADLSMHLQARLQAILEKQSFQRIGGDEQIPIKARILTATHQDLATSIASGKFREDLFYQLNVIPIEMPSLQSRKQDIPDLINELITRFEHHDQTSIRFNSSAIISLQRHPWKGNVRELANLVERMSIIKTNDVIGLHDLPLNYQHMDSEEEKQIESSGSSVPAQEQADQAMSQVSMSNKPSALQPLNAENFRHYLANFEKHLIQVALEDSDGMEEFAAARLELEPGLLAERKKHYQL